MAEGIKYYVQAILDAKARQGSTQRMDAYASKVQATTTRLQAAGKSMGGYSAQIAVGIGAAAAATASLAGAFGFAGLVKSAVGFNAQLEQMKYSMASTLQLMGHSSGDFTRNLDVSQAAMDKLFNIAAKSPATFEQASQMFNNMLPGARSVTDNMEDILELSKESLALGMIMGGDFQTTGAQLSRILTGGAGAEFETWKVLQKSILDAGKASGDFNKSLTMGSKLTEQFNQLAPEKRYELVRKATQKLGVATEAFGTTFAGVTSTAISDFQILKRELGKGLFLSLKSTFGNLTQDGGLLDPGGQVMKDLKLFANFIGRALSIGASKFAGVFERGVTYISQNWETIVVKFGRWVDIFYGAVKTLALLKTAQVAGGVGLQAVGGVGKAAGGVFKLVGYVGELGISSSGAAVSLGVVAVAMGVIAFAALGAATVVAGAAVFLVSKWDEIAAGIESGAVALEPLFAIIDLLFQKLFDLGAYMFGTTDAVSAANSVVEMLIGGFMALIDVLSVSLGAIGLVRGAFNVITAVIKLFVLGLTGPVEGILSLLDFLGRKVNDFLSTFGLSTGRESAGGPDIMGGIKDFNRQLAASINEDFDDVGKSFDAKKAFDEAELGFAAGFGAEEWLKKGVAKFAPTPEKKLSDDLLKGTKAAGNATSKVPGKGNINVNKMVVNQDLRNMDPDRVLGAFYQGIEKDTRKRTSSLALESEGI